MLVSDPMVFAFNVYADCNEILRGHSSNNEDCDYFHIRAGVNLLRLEA